MEETSQQQEKQELEYENPSEDQGGIRRRLRDRELLKKRKAEAEEKETNQWVFGVESQRKRQRAGDRSGAKRRGRPRKSEPTPEISVIQEEAAVPQEGPAVVVVSEPTSVISGPSGIILEPAKTIPESTGIILEPAKTIPESTGIIPEPPEVIPEPTGIISEPILPAVETKPPPVLTAPASQPVFGSIQRPLFGPAFSPAAPVRPTPSLFSSYVPPPPPPKDLDPAPSSVQDLAPAPDVPVPAVTQTPDPPVVPSQVGAFYVPLQDRELSNQVLIEDLGPDEEEDIPPSQDRRADDDYNGTPSINVPEQNKMFSVPTLSSSPPTQEYLPGNSF